MRARQRHLKGKSLGAVVQYDTRYITSSDGTAVGTLTDLCGNYDATETTGSKQPLVRTGPNGINGNTVIDFDGSNDDLQTGSISLNAYATIIVVGHFTTAKPFFMEHGSGITPTGFYFLGTNNNSWLVQRSSANHSAAGVSGWFGSTPAIGSFRYDGSGEYRKNAVVQSNNTVTGTSRSNTSFSGAFNVNSRNRTGDFADGLLGSVILLNETATTPLLLRIERSVGYSFKIACS
jgi:hypothetical protein